MARRGKRLKAGDRVQMLVRCKNVHLWVIRGVINPNGSIGCGTVTAPGAPDDPTCCKECGEPFECSYTLTRDDTPVEAAQEVSA